MQTQYEDILVSVDGPLCVVTVNRPKVLNALNARVIDELTRALTALQGQSDVRAIIVTGAGERAFVAGADIAAMAEALRLLLGGSAHVYAVTFGLAALCMQVFLPYQTAVGALKWLTLALLAYVAVVFSLHLNWLEVAQRTLEPQLTFNTDMLLMLVALFGTTISPYLFFWQASQEVEDRQFGPGRAGEPHTPAEVKYHLRRIKWDTNIGMGFSNLIAFSIILATAATLHQAGVTDIQTSAQAAEANPNQANPIR